MTAGERLKKAGRDAKNLTDRVVDAVEDKVNEATDAVEDAVHRAGRSVHRAASEPEKPKE